MRRGRYRAGDRVAVRSPEEILSTLDADGTLDGVPFMPEMLDWCGKPARIHRRVEKICVAVDPPHAPNRRFEGNDVVMLEESRCDGAGHDGCKRGCRIFWKEAWLRPIEAAGPPAGSGDAGLPALRARVRVKADAERYFCQSTQLLGSTAPFPGKMKTWTLRIAFREIRNGDRAAQEMARLFLQWVWQRVRRAAAGDGWLRGPQTRTPAVSLDFSPGDRVRVKSRDQIVETLDNKRRNRGMTLCYEMTRCCGREADVRTRVERIIDEKTGRMLELQDTVTLRNVQGKPTLADECLCYDELGDCPRGELMFWREMWLERADDRRS